MKATIMHKAGDVRVENVPDATLKQPTDALVRITHACICGSDLWPYHDLEPSENGRPMGHEAIGVVEAVGSDVRKVKKGDFVKSSRTFRLTAFISGSIYKIGGECKRPKCLWIAPSPVGAGNAPSPWRALSLSQRQEKRAELLLGGLLSLGSS